MNAAQAIALANHCRFAFETLHPRFARIVLPCSVVLTVNSGYE